MTLARHMPVFDFEDLSYRKDFGKKLYLLGLRDGETVIRLARDDELDYDRLYYIGLCDELVVRHGRIREFRGRELSKLKAKLYFAPVFRQTVYEAVSEFLEGKK